MRHGGHGKRRHGTHGAPGHGRYGNPRDLARMVARQEDPARDAWQKPTTVVRALALRRGQVVADIGAGPGYFTKRLARAVGAQGHVYAVDAEPAILEVLRERLRARRIVNVTPVLGDGDDPRLPPESCDVALLVDTYHHFAEGAGFLRRVARALRRRGVLVNIDFAREDTPVGPPVEHRISREEFLRDARRAGLRLVAEHRFLPYQYFLVLRRR